MEDKREEKKQERRKIYSAIEIIQNTRMKDSNYPVQVKEISIATKLEARKLDGTLRWLLRHGLIEHYGKTGYITIAIPMKGLCWLHGRYFDSVADCPKCKRAEQRQLEKLLQKIKQKERGQHNESRAVSRSIRRKNKQAHIRYYTERVKGALNRGDTYIRTDGGSIRPLKQYEQNTEQED